MDVNLTLPFPWWYALLCVLVGVAGALILYYKSGFEHPLGKWARSITFLARALVISLICFLLLSPLLKHIAYETHKPDVYIGIDQSASVGHVFGDNQPKVLAQIDALKSSLADDYKTHVFSIGNEMKTELSDRFDQPASDLNTFFQYINEDQTKSGAGAVILLSDGVFNKGPNPLFEAGRVKMPIYTVAVGDTNPAADLSIKNVIHNEIGFTGDISRFQVDVQSFNLQGKDVTVTLSQAEGSGLKMIQSKQLKLNDNNFFETIEFEALLSKPGQVKYVVAVTQLQGESTHANNTKAFYIDVIDSKLNIDLIAAGPHPDIAAIKSVVESRKNLDLKIHYINQPIQMHDKSDLIILYQVPTLNKFNSAFDQVWLGIQKSQTPLLFIVGGQSNVSRFNQLQPLLKINGHQGSMNDVYGVLMESYGMFGVRPEWKNTLPQYPPLQSPFGDFKADGSASVLMRQRIGRVDTDYPLWLTGTDNGRKMGIIAGEGIWRWRLNESAHRNQTTTFDDILGNTIRYLSTREDKRKFKVRTDDPIYTEHENILFSGELYNNNYELINSPEVRLTVRDQSNKEFKYILDKTDKAYFLDIGHLNPGEYTYQASVNYQGTTMTSEGRFAVNNVSRELFDLVADYGLMRQLAENSQGQMVALDGLSELVKLIQNNENIKPVITEDKKTDPLINLKWIFGVLIFLLTLEWFIRRYMGKY